MFVYLVLLILIICFSLSKNANNKYISIIIPSLIFLFMALRFDVGWDYRWYYSLAQRSDLQSTPILAGLKDINLSDFYAFQFYRIELLNKFIYKAAWALNFPQLVFIIYAFIIILFMHKGISQNIKNQGFAWLLFLAIPIFFFYSLSLMRQVAAMAIIFHSYKHIKNKKLIKYSLTIIAASLFHSTALIAFPIYFIRYFKISKKNIFLFIFSIIIIRILINILFSIIPILKRYQAYITGNISGGGNVILIIIIFIFLLLLLVNKYINIKLSTPFLSSIIGCTIYIVLLPFGHIGPRTAMYFLVFFLYLADNLLFIIKPTYITKYIFLLLTSFIFTAFTFYDYFNPIRSQYVPYNFFFQNLNHTFKESTSSD